MMLGIHFLLKTQLQKNYSSLPVTQNMTEIKINLIKKKNK